MSQDATCPESTADEVAAGWSQWAPSWEQWANDEQGGWTCTRSNTWAMDPPAPADPPASTCILADLEGDAWVEFGDGWQAAWNGSASAIYEEDPECAGSPAFVWTEPLVYATSLEEAESRCLEAFDRPSAEARGDNGVYGCLTP